MSQSRTVIQERQRDIRSLRTVQGGPICRRAELLLNSFTHLIFFVVIGTFIGKKCSPGTGGYTEGNSLIAGNVEDQEIEDDEEVQQQQVQN